MVDDSIATATTTTTTTSTTTATDSSPPPAATGAAAGSKKKFMGLGSYLPKVPSYLLQPKNGSGAASASGPVETAEDPADELKELPELADRRSNDADQRPPPPQPQQQSAAAAAAAAIRRRGMSIEQNVSTLYRRMTIRQSSSSTGSNNSSTADGSPSRDRNSLTEDDANALSPHADGANQKPRRGACVATKFGTGVVVDIRQDDGFYIVELVPKSVAYLREDMIIREIKSVVGERVKTRWGLATVEQYFVEDDMYSIALDWRWDDEHVWRMKATTKKFEKINPRGSIMQSTKNMLFEGYSTIRGSTSNGYANVVARLNNAPAAPLVNARGWTMNLFNKPKFQKGERVVTMMGSGFIVETRPLEKIYEVYLRRLKFTGYFHESALTAFPYERVTHFVVDGRTIPAPEIPRNVSEVKRRQVINAAIQSAREGKLLQAPGTTAAGAGGAATTHVPAPVTAPGAL